MRYKLHSATYTKVESTEFPYNSYQEHLSREPFASFAQYSTHVENTAVLFSSYHQRVVIVDGETGEVCYRTFAGTVDNST